MLIRMKAFITDMLFMLLTILIGFISSPEFANLLNEHWGETTGTAVSLLIINGVVKHLMNIKAINDHKAKAFGSLGEQQDPIILV